MTTALSVLRQRTLESMNDFIEVTLTTSIGADKKIISDELNKYDGATDNYFNGWYVYITDYNNIGVERQIADYDTSSYEITVRGANLTDETNATDYATVWVCRHSILQIIDKAINRAIEEVFPALHKRVDDLSLITGNILPDASFDWWTSSSEHKFISVGGAADPTLAQTEWSATNDEFIRGQLGSTSMKVTAAAGGIGYAVLSSDVYPRLLDLMDRTVSMYCWAYPVDNANDASIEIYTKQADGTAQTLTSTTANPKGEYTKLDLEDQALNDDLVEVQIRFKVAAASAVVYFDDAILCGKSLYEYLLPESFQDGYVNQVYLQVSGYSDEPAYDLHPSRWSKQGFRIIEGVYKYLRLDYSPANYHRLRLIGTSPLDALRAISATVDDTISIDEGGRTDLLIAYATYLLYEMTESPVSSEDISRYERESSKRYAKYMRLLRRHRMISPAGQLRV